MTNAVKTDEEIRNEAVEWLMRLDFDKAPRQERGAFEAWLGADPRHKRAYDLARMTWADLDAMHPASVGKQNIAARLAESFRGFAARPLMPAGAVAALGAMLAVIAVVSNMRPDVAPRPDSVFATRTAEIRDLVLPDGSEVTLGAKTAIALDFSPAERRVAMTGGEAFFNVTADENRPFIVEAGGAVVRVVGTRFDVRQHLDQVTVSVAEGLVEVLKSGDGGRAASGPGGTFVRLTEGQEAVATGAGVIAAVETVSLDRPGAWRAGRLVYDDAPLFEVIADANRYYDGEIHLADEDMKSLRITTAFRVDQVEPMLKGLPYALPVELKRRGRVVVVARRAAG